MAEARPTTSASHSPHWAATLAALVAMGALYLTGSRYIALPMLALVIVASHLTRVRIPNQPLALWPVRIIMLAIIIYFSGRRFTTGGMWFLEPAYIHLFGALCAGELAVQCWQRRSGSPKREVMLLSCLILAAATCNYNRRLVPTVGWMAPLYVLLVAISLREFRPRMARPAGRPRLGWWGLRLAAISAAFAIGYLTAFGLRTFGDQITTWPINYLFPKPPNLGATGLATSPQLGASMDIKASTARVLRIEDLTGDGHLRAMAFDTYDHGNWKPTFDGRTFQAVQPEQLASNSPGHRMRIQRLVDDPKLVYVPLNAAGVALPPGAAAQWEPEGGCAIQAWTVDAAPLTYDAIAGASPTHQGLVCRALTAEERGRLLAVPAEIEPAVRELAARIAADADAREKAESIRRHLQNEHTYSLSLRPASGRDPISDFLLEKRAAHCQYFASAAAILLRCAGIPARYVNGYYAHERLGDAIIVRQRDAHAWVEYWVEGVGWLALDATPESGLPDQAFEPIGRLQWLREWVEDLVARIPGWFAHLSWPKAVALAAGVAGCAMLLVMLRRLWRSRGRRLAIVEYAFPSATLAAVARRFARVLHGRRIAPAHNRTWREHLAALPDGKARPEVEAMRQFVGLYEHARFGRRDDAETIEQLTHMLEKIEK